MTNNDSIHQGQNIRAFRLLRGMKQQTFADSIGIAQQNVSKMEKKRKINDKQLEQAAEILNTTVDNLKNFDHKGVFQANIINENQVNNFNPIKEVIEYFEGKMEKANRENEELRAEISRLKYTNQPVSSEQKAMDVGEADNKLKVAK